MTWTTYLKNKMLDHLYNDPAFTAPSVYLALSTSTPAADGTGVTEPVGNNYARTQIPTASIGPASAGSKVTTADVVLPVPSGNWGTITYLCGFDALTNGNLLWFIDCADRIVNSGDGPKLLSGQLTHSL